MQKTIKVEGMTCSHCEMRVKKQLETLSGVESAKASADEGTAVVKLTQDVDEKRLKEAVEEAGYKYVGVE